MAALDFTTAMLIWQSQLVAYDTCVSTAIRQKKKIRDFSGQINKNIPVWK